MRVKTGLIILFLLALTGCGGGGGASSTEGVTDVFISIGSRVSTSHLETAAVPEVVRYIALSVSGEGMEPVERVYDIAGSDTLQITLQIPNGKLRHFVALALDENRNIRYRGEAYADLNGEPITINIMMVPLGDDPPEFGGLSFTEILSPTSVMLGWEPAVDDFTPQDNILYHVFLSLTPGGEDFLSPYMVVTGETTVTIGDLTPGETYYFVVRAFDEGGNSDGNTVELSVTLPMLTDNTPPVFGGIKSAVPGAPDTVVLSWDPATDDQTPSSEIVYRIYQSLTPGGEDFVNPSYITPPGDTAYPVTGLSPNTTYYFVVRAVDGSGNEDGNTVEVSVTTPVAPDTTPPVFGGVMSAVADAWDQVTLSWNPATDDQTPQSGIVYRIYQALTPGGENFGVPSYTTGAGVTTYTVTGLSGNTTYYFVVRAVDGSGNEDGNTVEVSVTTPLSPIYVNVNTGNDLTGDGSQLNPYKTITKAVSVALSGQTIYVESGIYDATTGEIFPIQMVPNTQIICTGAAFSTRIDAATNVVFHGAGGASVNGCFLSGSPAVNDMGNNMTISNCDIEGDGSTQMNGITLSGNSNVSNSTITNFYSEGIIVNSGSPVISNNSIGNIGFNGITVNGGNPLIDQNNISNTDTAVNVMTGNPTISSNTLLSNNRGVAVIGGSPGIDGNTISENYVVGVDAFGGIPVITNNIISGTAVTSTADGIKVGSGVGTGVLISGNTITNRNKGIIASDGCSIQGNDINGNSTGIEINNISGNQVIVSAGNLIYNNTAGINLLSGNPLIQGNSIFCNADFDFGDRRVGGGAAQPANITNNSWDHDTTTTPAGPVVDTSGQCLTVGGLGTDICYNSTSSPAPVFTPFGPAVTGGCL